MNHVQTVTTVRDYLSASLNPEADRTHSRFMALEQHLMNVTHHKYSITTLNSNDLIARFCRRVTDQEFCMMLLSPTLVERLEEAAQEGAHGPLRALCSYLSAKKFPLTFKEYVAECDQLPKEKQVEAFIFANGQEMDVTPQDTLRYRAISELTENRDMANAYIYRTMGAYAVLGALVGIREDEFRQMLQSDRLRYRLASAATPEQAAEDIEAIRYDAI